MADEPDDPARRIRAIFDRTVDDGWRADSVTGASDAQIDDMARAQRAGAVPVAVCEVLRLIGRQPGLWLAGSSLGVHLRGAEKEHTLAALAGEGDVLRDSAGMSMDPRFCPGLVARPCTGYRVPGVPAAHMVSSDRPEEREAAGGLRDFASYIAQGLDTDLRKYLFRLEEGCYPQVPGPLPDLR